MPNTYQKIPLPVIKRLPRYYRHIVALHQNGVETISSKMLAARLGTTASQVRQDFNCFGGFGLQGVGYNVQLLVRELEKLLFSGGELSAVLIGAGRLGRTMAHFLDVQAKGFKLVAAFDHDPEVIGRLLGNVPVQHVENLVEFCKEHTPQIAMLCIPEKSAADLAPLLPELGITGVWNFSNYDLSANLTGIAVENVHIGDSLQSLGYRVHSPAE